LSIVTNSRSFDAKATADASTPRSESPLVWDAVLAAFEPVPFSLYRTAAPKLPLSILWDFVLAFVLLGR